MIFRSRFLSPRRPPFSIRVDEIPYRTGKPRLEKDTGQREQRQLLVIPLRHSADKHVGVRRKTSEIELLPAGHLHRGHAVHREDCLVLVPLHVHLVPVTVVQVPADGEDLGAAPQVVPQSEGALHELDLEEVVGAPVVGVEQQAVRLIRFELELEASVRPASPFPELGIGTV